MSATVTVQNETFQNLLLELNIPDYEPSANMRALVAAESRFIKDMKINVGNVLNNSQYLDRKEAVLLALAVAVNEKFPLLQEAFTGVGKEEDALDVGVAEIAPVIFLLKPNYFD